METKSVFDVALYMLSKQGKLSAMKLQKLCYYAQAWSLVWDGRPLFGEPIEAWANGPVCPDLYKQHKGMFEVTTDTFRGRGDSSVFGPEETETLNAVLDYYGDKSPYWLSELTHAEAPWKDARKGLDLGERGKTEISLASMAEYYSSL